MNSQSHFTLSLLLLAAAFQVASAQQEPSDDIESFKDLTNDQLAKYLAELNISPIKRDDPDKDGDTLFKLRDNSRPFGVLHDQRHKQIRMYAVFSNKDGVTLKKLKIVNAWNGTSRFTKAVLDDKGSWVIESKLDYRNGATNYDVFDAVERFTFQARPQFRKFVLEWMKEDQQ